MELRTERVKTDGHHTSTQASAGATKVVALIGFFSALGMAQLNAQREDAKTKAELVEYKRDVNTEKNILMTKIQYQEQKIADLATKLEKRSWFR